MRHPRRNEVYRDVGSEPHDSEDAEFVDILEIPFEADSALLLCSDGLTDQIDSSTIADVVSQCVGEPEAVARALIEMANGAGGKDNVTAVYIEGEKFGASSRRYGNWSRTAPPLPVSREMPASPSDKGMTRAVIAAVVMLVVGFALGRTGTWLRGL